VANRTKLELTWIGKENRPKLQPRILLEDPEKSYHAKHVRISQRRDKKVLVSCKPHRYAEVGTRVLSGDTVHPQGVVRCEHVRG
jgi:hypothetical protein